MNQATRTVPAHDGHKEKFSVPALWDVDLELKAGEIHALVGEQRRQNRHSSRRGAYRRDSGVIEYGQGRCIQERPKRRR